MEGSLPAAVTALWLGLLTSLSPCPLATNVAAVSFIAREVGEPRKVFLAGALYALGRVVAYTVLAAFLVKSLLSAVEVSFFLQSTFQAVLGPILIVTGLVLLGAIALPVGGGRWLARAREKVERSGLWGSAALGALFALSFCPVSAALYFGSLIPLSIREASVMLLPVLYGLGTSAAVLAFAAAFAAGVHSVARVFQRITAFERWARIATGVVFVMVGIYETVVSLGAL